MSSSLEGEFGVELFDCNDEAPLACLNMSVYLTLLVLTLNRWRRLCQLVLSRSNCLLQVV